MLEELEDNPIQSERPVIWSCLTVTVLALTSLLFCLVWSTDRHEQLEEYVVPARPGAVAALGAPIPVEEPVELVEAGQEPVQVEPNKFAWVSKFKATRKAKLLTHPLCEACGCSSECAPLNAHHVISIKRITDEKLADSLRWDETNLIVLCRSHHRQFGHPNGWQTSNPDVRSDAAKNFFRTRPGWTYEELVADFEFNKPIFLEHPKAAKPRASTETKTQVAP